MRIANILTTALLIIAATVAQAQETKKPERAVLNVVTYDASGKLLRSGNAFYIDADGTALSDYDLFKGAHRADAIDADGKKYNVSRILGTNELYNIVKFRTDASRTPYLPISATPSPTGAQLRVITYAKGKSSGVVQTSVVEASKFGGNTYYKLSTTDPQLISLPLVNTSGSVVGITQRGASADDKQLYALDAAIGKALDIKFFTAPDNSANAIRIPTGLPSSRDDANSYVYMLMKGSNDSISVIRALDDFITTYPDDAEGYSNRAQFYATRRNYAAASSDLDRALQLSPGKDDIHYITSRIIYSKALTDPTTPYADWTLQRALDEATKAYDIKPEPLYTLQQADCFFGLKEYGKAYDKYLATTQTTMRSAELFLYAAQAKESAGGERAEVLALVDSALAFFPRPYYTSAAPYILKRATLLQGMGRNKEAVREFTEYETLIGRENLNENFYTLRYTSAIEGKLFQQAINDLDHLITLSPHNCMYRSDKAYVYLVAGETDTAISTAQSALTHCSDNADLYKILGIAYGEKGNKTKAQEALNKSIALGDESAKEIIKKYR